MLKWTVEPNSKICENDYVKDTFSGKIGRVLSFQNRGRDNLATFQDLKTNKIEMVLAARLIKVEKEGESKWLQSSWLKQESERYKGLIISPYEQAESILKGEKTIIVKSKLYKEIPNNKWYIVFKNRVYGLIEIRDFKRVSFEEFENSYSETRVKIESAMEWWGSKIKREGVYLYPFKLLEVYKTPKSIYPVQGSQTIIPINFKER